MAKTKLNEIKGILNELKAIRASIEPLKKQEKILADKVKEYLIENDMESLDTAECTAILRHTPKFKVFDKEEALAIAVKMNIKTALKLDETSFGNVLAEYNIDKSVWGTDTEDIAVRITYRKK